MEEEEICPHCNKIKLKDMNQCPNYRPLSERYSTERKDESRLESFVLKPRLIDYGLIQYYHDQPPLSQQERKDIRRDLFLDIDDSDI